tara:strand:- start:10669 stop:11550 length:882 start_codon:yes stop_codon:yes gene_type:complete
MMIAKLESIAHTQNALSYCEQGGEIIYSNQCLGNSKDIYLQMLENNAFNDRCSKQTFHIKIRIAPEDKGKLNTQNWIDIANSYANKIGFQDNPFAVYIHEEGSDSKREHIHIVASKIKSDNLAVSDSYTHYQNMDFCREIEEKYNLRRVDRVLEKIKNNEAFQSSDKRIQPLKEKIFKAIDSSDTMEDLIFLLKIEKIKVKISRGIGFTDEKGVYFKGSSIDRKLSLKGIEKLLSYEHQQNQQLEQNTEQSTEKFNSDLIFDTVNNLIENNSDSNDFEEDTKKRKRPKKRKGI